MSKLQYQLMYLLVFGSGNDSVEDCFMRDTIVSEIKYEKLTCKTLNERWYCATVEASNQRNIRYKGSTKGNAMEI